MLLHRLGVLQEKAACPENARAMAHLQLAQAALMERADRMFALQVPGAIDLVPGDAVYRRVTPHECPQCHALWLFWPKEQSGFDTDTLNLRSAHSCPYCEGAGVDGLTAVGQDAPQPRAPA